jgi:hypothetical protein
MLTGAKWALIPLPITGVAMAIGLFLVATLMWLLAVYVVVALMMARSNETA